MGLVGQNEFSVDAPRCCVAQCLRTLDVAPGASRSTMDDPEWLMVGAAFCLATEPRGAGDDNKVEGLPHDDIEPPVRLLLLSSREAAPPQDLHGLASPRRLTLRSLLGCVPVKPGAKIRRTSRPPSRGRRRAGKRIQLRGSRCRGPKFTDHDARQRRIGVTRGGIARPPVAGRSARAAGRPPHARAAAPAMGRGKPEAPLPRRLLR